MQFERETTILLTAVGGDHAVSAEMIQKKKTLQH